MPRIKILRVEETVRKIIRDVERDGDRALFRYTQKFDRVRLTPRTVEVSKGERRRAWKKLDRDQSQALREAADRIRKFHARGLQKSWTRTEKGFRTGLRWLPLARVGIYVPGGRASYPSSVLMNAIPASVAGVPEIVMATPCPEGKLNPAVLVAADLAGVDRIFKVGGAQAIAALAFGTKTIPKVDKIVGPGNRFVAEAKRQVFGQVAIDMIAGPSELIVIADESANPAWVAMDLIAQAEHDPEAVPVLISPSSEVLRNVARDVEKRVPEIDRREIAHTAFRKNGEKIKVRDLKEACEVANERAPEHLSLQVRNPQRLLPMIQNAGAIFLGPYSAVALGDYAAGPNHVLPTGGTARHSSPLGVYDFQKATSVIQADRSGLARLCPIVARLARMENLTAHAESVEVRL